VRLAEALPGCAQNDAEAAHACLDRAVECRACLAVNQADGLARDCDLFDDGQDNTSCPPLLVGAHTCTLDEEQSGFLFDSAAGFLLGSLAGSLRLSCANADPATGEGSCSCAIEEIAPVAVPGTGWACIAPVDGCSRGTIACNGGRSLDYALVADHVIGTCTGNQDCATQCAALCDASSARVFDSGCEGFCEGGARDSLACTGDGQCSGGSCNGAASNAHGNVCQCQCIEDDGEESREGGLRCDLGVGIRIERNLPCDGADVLMDLGSRCVPFTTEESFAILHDQDAEPGADLPAGGENLFGEPVACSTFAAGGPAGLVLGSVVNTFDVARVGDVHMLLALVCE
jgi:hypothetical protein